MKRARHFAVGLLLWAASWLQRWAGVLLACTVLWASSSGAQVTNLCGPGKVCNVARVNTSNTTTAICENGGSGTYWAQEPSLVQWGVFKTTNACSGGTNLLGVNTSSGVVNLGDPTVSGYFAVVGGGYATGSTGAGVAFGSFPSCAAGTAGHLLYDSTNLTWRQCDGTRWQAVQSNANFTAYYLGGPALHDGTLASTFLGASSPTGVLSGQTFSQITCNYATAGTGGTTTFLKMRINDTTQGTGAVAATQCSCSMGTGSCSTAFVPFSCACAGVVNSKQLTVQIDPASDCTTYPSSIVCNVQ